MPSEFEVISRYFTRPAPSAVLGVGDDAALLRPSPGCELAISTDMLVSGRHFFADADPEKLGHKSLAVNLSDLAAMGAKPRWALLSLALPEADADWLAAFARGFFRLAERHGVDLIGGDTTRGPLNINVTILGEVEAGRALRRDGAKPGDDIWVSGELGGAALGLRHGLGTVRLEEAIAHACLQRLDQPEPRLALGQQLIGLANAAIDVSDGLLADLGHILERSRLGARVELAAIPAAPALLEHPDLFQACALAGGDDYELCFTAPADRREAVLAAAATAGVRATRIGIIRAEPGLELIDAEGRAHTPTVSGYDHFGKT